MNDEEAAHASKRYDVYVVKKFKGSDEKPGKECIRSMSALRLSPMRARMG